MENINQLVTRRDELLCKQQRFKEKLQIIEHELQDINTALNVLAKYGLGESLAQQVENSSKPKTVADMALVILSETPDGLTANEILDIIRKRWMPDLARTSLSPPLSRLKAMGKIRLQGQHWILSSNVNNVMDVLE